MKDKILKHFLSDAAIVITSYSIHYTKLYDLVPSANDVDVWVASVGAGVRLGKRLQLDLAAYHVSGQRTQQGQESFDQDHTMAVIGLRWGP